MGVCPGQRQPDLSRGDPHAGADPEQLQPDRGALGPGVYRAGQPQASESVHQDVGERGAVEPKLIGPDRGAAGAVGEQAELLFLDAVLHLAPGDGVDAPSRRDQTGRVDKVFRPAGGAR